MCDHEYKNYIYPLVLNFTSRKMEVDWKCMSCGVGGKEEKIV